MTMTTLDNNFIPRPVPKPTQLEPVVHSKPEVPEASLVFDHASTNDSFQPASTPVLTAWNTATDNGFQQPNQFNGRNYYPNSVSEFHVSSVTDQHHQSNRFHGFNNISRLDSQLRCSSPSKSSVIDNGSYQPDRSRFLTNSLSSDSSSFKKKSESPNVPRKVSFSFPQQSMRNDSSVQPSNTPKNSMRKMQDDFSYCNSDIDHYLFPEEYSLTKSTSFDHETKPPEYNQRLQNDVCTRNKSICSGCCNSQINGFKNSISIEEVQKMTLKFENMLLKLNYKFIKMFENFVSKDEVNLIMKKYDDKIEMLTKKISELSVNLQSVTIEPPNPIENLEQFEVTKSDFTHQTPSRTLNLESKRSSPYDNITGNRISPRIPSDIRDKRNEKLQNNFNDNQNCRDYNSSPNSYSTLRSTCVEEQIRNREEHLNPVGIPRSVPSTSLAVNEEKHESPRAENRELLNENYTNIPKKHDENHQLRILYENIVKDVGNVIGKNVAGNYQIDTIDIIRKATIDQFRKMGINVDELDERQKRFNDSNTANTEVENKIPEIPSSDLSLHMNSLAMKYIHDNNVHEREQAERRQNGNDLSIRSHCNNISIATLQYMERYQLLSSDALGQDKFEYPQNSRTRFREKIGNSDRSFIR